jgi:MFS transporter, AAHS family, 4-hydroxybenzoate transporter
MATAPRIDVQDFINSRPISGFQWVIIALCFAVLAVDGFDATAISFIAPAIRTQWNLTPGQLAPLFGAGLFGLMLGAFLFGPLADKAGRRPTLIITTAFFAIATIASAFVTSIEMLIGARFLTGLGLGGAMPIAVALTAEFSPECRRSSLVTLMFCGFVVGSATAGVVASLLVDAYGWQSFLILTGSMPLVVALALWAWLPESVRFLTLKDVAPAEIASMLRRIAPETNFAGVRFVAALRPSGSPVAQLFAKDLAIGTVLLWLTFFMSLLVFYLLSSWLPFLITSAGFSIKNASLMSTALAVGGAIGAIVIGRLMDRFNPHWVLAGFYGLAAVFIALLGVSTAHPLLLVAAVFVAGFGAAGAQIGMNALAAAHYQTANRATGVSWAAAVGRFGSVLGSMVGGMLLSFGWEIGTIFTVAAIPALVAGVAMLIKSFVMSAAPSLDPVGQSANAEPLLSPLIPAVKTR